MTPLFLSSLTAQLRIAHNFLVITTCETYIGCARSHLRSLSTKKAHFGFPQQHSYGLKTRLWTSSLCHTCPHQIEVCLGGRPARFYCISPLDTYACMHNAHNLTLFVSFRLKTRLRTNCFIWFRLRATKVCLRGQRPLSVVHCWPPRPSWSQDF
jgi:hypothetical protein